MERHPESNCRITGVFTARGKSHEDARENIDIIEAPDRRGEVDAAARKIQDLLHSGLRLRDIAVLMRSIDDYEELIGASFVEHGIPYFADRRRTAGHHPLLQFTRAALQIASSRLAARSGDDAAENGTRRIESG